MSVSSMQAANVLCELSNWKITNLKLQKVLYFAHMYHLGMEGLENPLINEEFEAWVWGPVEPELYHRVKVFGSGSIVKGTFFWDGDVDKNGSEYKWLSCMFDATENMESGELIDMTHWEEGAWQKVFGRGNRNELIPNERILQEFRARNELS